MVEHESEFLGAFLVGSFAADSADFVSDVDLVVVALDGGYNEAWERRGALHATGALAYWDEHDGVFEEAAVHAWLAREIVLVECLIATPSSGARLAEPFEQLVGPAGLPDRFQRQPPIGREAMTPSSHPVGRAYEQLVRTVRERRQDQTETKVATDRSDGNRRS